MSKKSTSRAMRRVTGASLSGALAAGMMLAATPVQAADDVVEVKQGDIAPTETSDNYKTWHQGQAGAENNHGVTADGLTLFGKSQVIKGLTAPSSTDKIAELSYTVTKGDLWLQIPMTFTNETNVDKFTTLRPNDPASVGDHAVSLTDEWTSSQAIAPGFVAHGVYPLGEILEAMEDPADDHVLAFGVFTDTNFFGSVSDMTWDDTTYKFVADAPSVTKSTVTNGDLRDEETGSTYTEWHQGYSDATANHQVTADGLELAGKSQIIKGFSNNSSTINARNANLPFALLNSSYNVIGSDPVTFQVPLFFDNGSGSTFTTLRNLHPTEGVNDFALDDEWMSSKAIGSIPADTATPLHEIITALGNYKVIAYGVKTNPNDSAVVSNITFDDKSYDFKDAPPAASETSNVKESDIAADEDPYEGWHQGAADGAATVDNGVLQLGTETSQVIKGYANNSDALNAKNADLRDVLRGASYNVSAGTAFFQIPMFFEDPISHATLFTTLRPADPKAGLNTFSLGDEWISTKAIGGVISANHGSAQLGDILSALKTYKVLAFGVFSDSADAEVSDITWDGTKYTFLNADPEAAELTASTRVNTPVDVTLTGTDAEGDTLTYSAENSEHGTVAVDGTKLTYTPTDDFAGTDTVTYTVNDGRTKGNATGEVEITVKANGAPVVTDQVKDTRAGDQEFIITDFQAVDPEGDAISYEISAAENGTAVKFGGAVLYQADADFVGVETLTVTATDEFGAVGTGTLTINVNENGAPEIEDATATTPYETAVEVPLSATDPEGDPVTYTAEDSANGTVVVEGSTLTYTPEDGFSGEDEVTVTATDDRDASSTATVTITVSDKVNNAPVGKYTTGTTNAGQDVTIKLAATDADGDALTYTAPEKSDSDGTVTVDGDELTYTPVKGFGGIDNVVVTASDTSGAESRFLVRIKVNAVRPSMSLKLSPKAPTSRSNITATVKIVVPDTVVASGANVYIFDGRKRIGAAKMDADGTISIKVSKLKKGTHKVTARFYGTKSVARTDRVRTLKIKK